MTQALRTLIVDDEPAGRERLRHMLRKHRDVEIAGECSDAESATEQIRATPPDAVFLDVQMPGADGFDLVAAVGPRAMPAVVFVTAHEEHALRAFEVDAVDYLLKPFDENRFGAALARVREDVALRRRRSEGERRKLERLALRSAGRVRFLNASDIEWIDAAHNYVRIHDVGGATHVVREALRDFEARLDPERFVRIHRSTIINNERVREFELTARGTYIAIVGNGQRLTVSRSFRHHLPALLGNV